MKSGGQNEHIGKDLTHLPRAHGILEHVYTGGWSAIVDVSKFFHNFPTLLPSDRPYSLPSYLGCIHTPGLGNNYGIWVFPWDRLLNRRALCVVMG
jgi:hypothetical protein